ncbi:MAG: sugar transferase [Acidimicrobiales bacterium]
MKRIFDIVVALLILVLVTPVLAGIALAIRFTDGSGVLFRQERIGLEGRTFVMRKFRTMSTPSSGRSFDPATDAVRITRLGQLLRSTSLDELPTLINVLVGDMSLVGPRPLPVEYRERYTAEQFRRHEVRPGVTGLAQVRGRNRLSWDDRFALDVEYVETKTMAGDIRLLAATVLPVLSRSGVSGVGAVTMSEFRGTVDDAGVESPPASTG